MLKIITTKDDDKKWDCLYTRTEEARDMQERGMKRRKGTTRLHCTEFFLPIDSIKWKVCFGGRMGKNDSDGNGSN